MMKIKKKLKRSPDAPFQEKKTSTKRNRFIFKKSHQPKEVDLSLRKVRSSVLKFEIQRRKNGIEDKDHATTYIHLPSQTLSPSSLTSDCQQKTMETHEA